MRSGRLSTTPYAQLLQSRGALLASIALLALAALFAIRICLHEQIESIDFKALWVAGRMWDHGLDPYSPSYVTSGFAYLPKAAGFDGWFYPFHWIAAGSLLGLIEPHLAFRLWQILSFALLVIAILLTRRIAIGAGLPANWALWLLLLAYCFSGTICGALLRNGQPAILSICGIPFVAYGLKQKSLTWSVIGTFFLLLKPQIGLPCIVALALLPGGLLPVLIGGLLTAIAAIPAMLIGGGTRTIGHLLHNAQVVYAANAYNRAPAMAGISNLLYLISGIEAPLFAVLASATIFTALVTLLWRLKSSEGRHPTPIASAHFFLTAPVICVLCVSSLHPYDLAILFFPLPFALAGYGAARWLTGLGMLIAWRPENVVHPLGGESIGIAFAFTVGIILIAAGVWIGHAWRARPIIGSLNSSHE